MSGQAANGAKKQAKPLCSSGFCITMGLENDARHGADGGRMEYIVDDKRLKAPEFIAFVNGVWPGEYDPDRTQEALSRTVNITAYDGDRLVGCLRILTDGYFFGTITELLVLPAYQRKGIGSRLLGLAGTHTPTMLYFGSQPGAEAFYEKNGCRKGLPSYVIGKKR